MNIREDYERPSCDEKPCGYDIGLSRSSSLRGTTEYVRIGTNLDCFFLVFYFFSCFSPPLHLFPLHHTKKTAPVKIRVRIWNI